ncbi:hypothetical protein RRG08_005454 [Elysia crispata]|uniref:Uncharacterized protein n=1 Tax=Elysia crispata TaxID=231223 RepID=A0AAE0Y2D9_9GAST|nr:hypothetical protein RRG08_005454 [Elysia crispata]
MKSSLASNTSSSGAMCLCTTVSVILSQFSHCALTWTISNSGMVNQSSGRGVGPYLEISSMPRVALTLRFIKARD